MTPSPVLLSWWQSWLPLEYTIIFPFADHSNVAKKYQLAREQDSMYVPSQRPYFVAFSNQSPFGFAWVTNMDLILVIKPSRTIPCCSLLNPLPRRLISTNYMEMPPCPLTQEGYFSAWLPPCKYGFPMVVPTNGPVSSCESSFTTWGP